MQAPVCCNIKGLHFLGEGTSADVYLERPFGVGELIARQRVPLRRSSKAGGINPAVRWIVVDLDTRLITRNVKPVNLRPEAYIMNRLAVPLHRHL